MNRRFGCVQCQARPRHLAATELNTDLAMPPPAPELPFKIGVPTGIRTPVLTVKGWCPRPLDDGDAGLKSNYRNLTLSYSNGGARRDRTADLLHAMQALSQLSYGPMEARDVT
jgi:hypothetical protein